MKFRIFLFACFCLCFGAELFGQVVYIDRRFWHDDGKVDMEQPLVFDVIPYVSPMLDMRGFQLRHPEIASKVPEYIEIVPPSLEGLRNPGVAVAWIGVADDDADPGQLVMMFMGNYSKEMPRYYVDRNFDRAFVNDGPPVVFNPGHTQEKVGVKKPNSSSPAFEFWLMAPEDYEEVEHRIAAGEKKILTPNDVPDLNPQPDLTKSVNASTVKSKELGRYPLEIRGGLTFGTSRIAYNYRAASTGFPVSYEVSSTKKGLFIGANYRLKGIRIGLVGGLEHIFWWSSYKTTRISDPYEICDPYNANHCTTVPGVEVETNRDRLPELRFNLGFNLEYLFAVMHRIRLGPYVTPMVSTYRPSYYVPEVVFEDQAYEMGPDMSFEGGLRVEVRPTDRQAFMFSAAYTASRFLPRGFFEEKDIRLNGLYSQKRGFRAYLGYTFLLF